MGTSMFTAAVSCAVILLSGCATSAAKPVPLAGYKTSATVVLDGERGTNEWQDAERALPIEVVFGQGKSEGKSYQRHYVWCMYDNNWLYLAVRTFCADPGTVSVHFPGDEPCDGFPFAIFSEEKVVLSTEILQDGISMPPWKNWARKPSRQDVLKASANLGLELKTKTRPEGHEWTLEIRIPLSRLELLGHQVYVGISGNKGRLHLYPKTRAVNWTPNAS